MGQRNSIMDNELVQGFYKKAHNRDNDTFHRVWNLIVSFGGFDLSQFVSDLHFALILSLTTNSSSAKYSGDRPRHRYSLLLLLAQDDRPEYI